MPGACQMKKAVRPEGVLPNKLSSVSDFRSKLKKETPEMSPVPRYKFAVLLVLLPLSVSLLAYEGPDPGNPARQAATLNLERDWPRLSVQDKRTLAPYLLERCLQDGTLVSLRQALSRESDSAMRNYAEVVTIYASAPDPANRLRLLRALRDESSRQPERADLVSFYAALEAARVSRQLDVDEFLRVCRFPEQNPSCLLVRALREARSLSEKTVGERDLARVLSLARPFLANSFLRPPFYSVIGQELPDRLFGLGLPLEAAIIADHMTYNDDSAAARIIRSRIPLYLVGAADFDSAIRFSMRDDADTVPQYTSGRLDWMILGGRYHQAIDYMSSVGLNRIAAAGAGSRDYWTGFPYSEAGLKLTGAMLMHLAGDSRNAAQSLEHLTDMAGDTVGGEPARYYARLRLAQILVKENPELSHRIAEDVTYVAQENSWFVLEYHATLIDGWALYFAGQDYLALINFIKAQGILQGENRTHIREYSHLLGMLAVRNRLAPAGDYSTLINRLGAILSTRPYNQAIYTLREWAPAEAGTDFFLEQAVNNLQRRGQTWAGFNLLLGHASLDSRFFQTGNNPGGARGFLTSVAWSQEAGAFEYLQAADYPSIATGARTGAEVVMREVRPALTAASFSAAGNYLFSLPLGSGRRVYLVHSRNISFIDLGAGDVAKLREGCNRETVAACHEFQDRFAALQQKMGRVTQGLAIQYAPRFDLNFERLLFPSGTTRPIIFFARPIGADDGGAVRDRTVYRAGGCPVAADLPRATAVPDFEQAFSGGSASGVWLWPIAVDARASRQGGDRPVYLRKFLCGNASLRLWDLDRFSQGQAPELIVFRARRQEQALDLAFSRHFSERGTVLLEVSSGTGSAHAVALIERLASAPAGSSFLSVYLQPFSQTGGAGMRLIVPGIPAISD